ncbi:DUF551 domain-containing protein [Cronobacter sakazakii]|nr:DUF551 domain-containing protein [Cronobacter sakazakii]MDK1224681.1 DUF551 domain-containing protein [Cronobacter turicensis]KAB0819861.1 DUF551 domain-containing protein [Cronobacter sakazakii]MDI7514723.1 DUF551 domain-containing protein [Cronobacter sakazakii]MDI7522473.1 DUF551 domain-containing protein [Cronobacter sakazakii]
MTFTKEQLIAAAHGRIDFANMMLSDNPEPLKERTWSIELELARIALSALRERAEPVAYADPQAFRNFQAGTANKEWMWAKPGAGLVPVFVEAPPAPVDAGWIACSERMPELDTRVLLYFPDYGGHIEDGCIGDEGDGHYHYFFDGYSLRHEPTHWMPLPEAPGKEG